jgi:hypothetical protein
MGSTSRRHYQVIRSGGPARRAFASPTRPKGSCFIEQPFCHFMNEWPLSSVFHPKADGLLTAQKRTFKRPQANVRFPPKADVAPFEEHGKATGPLSGKPTLRLNVRFEGAKRT